MLNGGNAHAATSRLEIQLTLIKRLFACIVLACVSLATLGVLVLFAIGAESFRLIFGKWFLLEVVLLAMLWYPFVKKRMS
jgi:hypothetical protein